MWEDPWDVEELIAHTSTTNSDDLPDWSPQYVSRTSLDRVRIHPDKIPTLSVLAKLPLPPPPPPHPSRHAKAYALHRKRQQYRHVQKLVGTAVPPSRIFRIQSLPSWEDKQDAVDELFEQVETELKDREPILGKHPNFGTWVEKALEEHLRGIGKKISDGSASSDLAVKPGAQSDDVAGGGDETAVPVFMDCFVDGKDSDDSVVPSIVSPLGAKSSDGGGRMVEEWELAAHRTSKRILLRQSTREAARLMAEVEAGGDSGPSRSSTKRILLHGRQGVGKTAALAALVASARTSGCVVLYVADTDDLRRNGFYVEPNPRHPGVFDLPVLSQLICQQLLKSHEADLSTFDVPPGVLQEHFTPDQLKQLGVSGGGGAELSLANVLKAGAGKPPLAPGCYSVAMEILMTQDKVPFWVAVDEFNCLLEPSLYYHMDYDVDVKKPIPLDQISLFRPLLRAMQVSYSSDPLDEDGTLSLASESSAIRRGGAVAATSESRAVSRKLTDGLVECARLQAASAAGGAQSPIRVVEVPRLSALEVEHVLANYEAVGIGKLRMDQGETVLNEQEVAYLRIVSGGVAQRLMDACIL
jgi:Mitochondrial ribosomal death-associated protein 3